jgi:hypothetical protein
MGSRGRGGPLRPDKGSWTLARIMPGPPMREICVRRCRETRQWQKRVEVMSSFREPVVWDIGEEEGEELWRQALLLAGFRSGRGRPRSTDG